MKNIIRYGVLSLAAAMTLCSCDWTEPEAVDLRYDTIQASAPDAYAKYLENLRAYHANGHKKVYAWFENRASFVSQADHVSAVPDSIDVLVLQHPEAMSQSTLDEIDTKRSETGMQTAYVVSYEAIRKQWDLKKELETPDAPVQEWRSFMTDSVKTALGYFLNGGFDRVICGYDGKDMSVYTQEERDEYEGDQKAFLDLFRKWRNANINKGFDFCGIPANMVDVSLLDEATTIFLSETADATHLNSYGYILLRNSVAGAPTEKFAVIAPLPMIDETQASVGYWGTDYCAWLAARWARTANVAALGLYNLTDDYYNPTFIYPVARGAIQILNPAAK